MNRRVLITAGASGIGREFVRAFAAKADKVFVGDIDAAALEILKKDIPEIVTSVADMSSRADIEQMVDAGATALGGYDVLINNAGIAGPTSPVDEINPEDGTK